MQSNWENIFNWCLVHEGGYVNHPKDPGGATNQGVTQRVYDAYRKRSDKPTQSVRVITDKEVRTIYRAQYWDRIQGEHLPSGVDYAVYDFAVNSGTSRSAKYLQKVVGVTPDGDIGQMTLAAVAAMPAEQIIQKLCNNRMAFLKRLRHWPTFGRGWSRRVVGEKAGFQERDTGVLDRSIMLGRNKENIPPPIPRNDGANAKGEGDITLSAKIMDTVKDSGATVTTGLAASGTLLTTLSSPPIAYFVGAALVLAVMGGVYLLVQKQRNA